eukprot:gene3027-13050_t
MGNCLGVIYCSINPIICPMVPYFTIGNFLGVIYCSINPIICPVVLIFISLGIICQRYSSLYIFKRRYESGGSMWSSVFTQFMVSLYFHQVFMILVAGLKEFGLGLLITPAFLITITFHIAVFMMIVLGLKEFGLGLLIIPAFLMTITFHIASESLFKRPWRLLSVHDAAMLGVKDAEERGQATMGFQELHEIRTAYLSPVFKVRLEDDTDLIHEAIVMSRRINGLRMTHLIHEAIVMSRRINGELGGQAQWGGGQATMGFQELHKIRTAYLSPVFKVNLEDDTKVRLEDDTELIHEAVVMSRRINGEKVEDIEADLEEAGYVSADEGEGQDEMISSVTVHPVQLGSFHSGHPVNSAVAVSIAHDAQRPVGVA